MKAVSRIHFRKQGATSIVRRRGYLISFALATILAGGLAYTFNAATDPFVADMAGSNAVKKVERTYGRPGVGVKIPRSSGSRSAGQEPVDWDHPFVDPAPAISSAAAANRVPFKLIVPQSSLLEPISVVTHAIVRPDAAALLYNDSTFGRFNLIEEPTTMTQAALEAFPAGCHPETGCEGSWTIVMLADGTRALSVEDPPNVDAIAWLRGGVQFSVLGPATSFTPASAVAVANAVENAAH